MCRVPDSVWFDWDEITDIPELVPVHLWLDHTITSTNSPACFDSILYNPLYVYHYYLSSAGILAN